MLYKLIQITFQLLTQYIVSTQFPIIFLHRHCKRNKLLNQSLKTALKQSVILFNAQHWVQVSTQTGNKSEMNLPGVNGGRA